MGILNSLLNPAIYHGHNKTAPFFEGWYYKLVSADETTKYAIIPGVFLKDDGFAFIQVLDGNSGETEFIKFPLDTFSAAKGNFNIQIDNNIFQLDNIYLDIDRSDFRLKGELSFSNVIGWPISVASPGVMGWYAWIPGMECYHGVLGFDHEIKGFLQPNNNRIDFTGGRGYIEKDWGSAFPEGYVWMQTNHFQQPAISLTASIAIIPWLGSEFRGFIVGLWIDSKLYRFATYTGAKTDLLEVTDSEVFWQMSDRNYRLEIKAKRGLTGDLKGPTRQDMGMRVAESLNANIYTKLESSAGQIIFDGTGHHAGLEVAGNIHKLLQTS
jgi:hypothetical protein